MPKKNGGFFSAYKDIKIALVYIQAGNGHYIPAKNLYESFQKLGINSLLVDFHKDICNNPKASTQELKNWRFISRFPHIQRFIAFFPQKVPFIKDICYGIDKIKGNLLKKYINEFIASSNITHIITTAVNPIPTYITEVKKNNKNVKIFCFPPDFVFIRNTSLRNKKIDKYLCPSKECHNYITQKGIKNDRILDIPFPIQSSFIDAKNLTKEEARNQLKIDSRFTILYQIGGVGEGNLKLLELLSKNDESVRVIILGSLQPNMQKRLKRLQLNKKNFSIMTPGFTTNPGLYLKASDILLERSGANATTEALFLETPVMTITLYDCGIPYANFIKKNKIGYVTQNPHKQYKIIKHLIENPIKLETLKQNIRNLHLQFNSDTATKIISEYIINK